jgi:Sec-independent protein translocase protein TatA
MFDVSWGETFVVVGLGLFLIGRQDLPKAARVAGTHVGRIVGWLQGARASADAFAQTNELRALHNEVKSGLRELDAVKAELAVSLSPSQMMQGQRNNLGTMVPSANRIPSTNILSSHRPSSSSSSLQLTSITGTPAPPVTSYASNNGTFPPPSTLHHHGQQQQQQQDQLYKSHHASIAAVAEEEWIKQGIHFRSRAERGPGTSEQQQQQDKMSPSFGSALLSRALQQSLIFDQYDRVIQEQEQNMQNRMQSIQEKFKEAAQTTSSSPNSNPLDTLQ